MLGLSSPIIPMRQAGVYLRKFAIFVHRWLGLAFCLLFALWFISGFVMMYSDYPSVSSKDRLSKAKPLFPGAIHISPQAAYSALHRTEPPDQVVLTVLDGRPIYRFRRRGSLALVYADDGEVFRWLSQAAAGRIAAAWSGEPVDMTKFQGALMEADQWTLAGQLGSLRPLLKYTWPDGQEVYISGITGEVVQHTTRASRIAAYFGAIPHWLYFAPLRKNGRLWTKVVVWSSGIGTAASLLGLAVGISMYSPTKRFRYAGQPSSLPYRGQKRWHLILGLIFGLVTCTWVFSGLLSMEPFDWLSDDDDAPSRVATALRGGRLNIAAFEDRSPSEALQQVASEIKAKELELTVFAGEPYYLARESPAVSRIVPIRGDSSKEFDSARILKLVAQAAQPAVFTETRLVTSYEAYYLDRHQQHPLPALFVRLNDAGGSMFYIDPKSARLVAAYGGRSRWNRWLYHGLHSWDVPWLYRYRPAWDIFVLLLMLGGTSLCVTSVIIAFQFVRRKLSLEQEQLS
jgi:PepSY-associated TM region